MTTDAPTCSECHTPLAQLDTDPAEWVCLGPCIREQIVWKTWTGGRVHPDPEYNRLHTAENQITQRNAGTYAESEYCKYCLDACDSDRGKDYESVAKTLRCADDPEAAIAEYFGGEAQP